MPYLRGFQGWNNVCRSSYRKRFLLFLKLLVMKKKETNVGTDHPRKQQQVKILDTDKGTLNRNPLHGSLSENPEKENKAVRHSEKNAEKNKSKH